MDIAIVIIVALGASILTFFSGFGLGTILTPAFLLFFTPEIAVAATAIVHFLNNLFKLTLIGSHVNWKVVLRFGLPAIVGAFIGAKLLSNLADFDRAIQMGSLETSFLNVVLGVLILLFALVELLPGLKDIHLDKKWLVPGGLLSGFFGGLSGHQGALRSAFLIKLNLSKEQFVASGIMIACMIDSIRITSYATSFDFSSFDSLIYLVVIATLAAFAGAIAGKYLLKKVTISLLQNVVGFLMIAIAALLILGII